MLAVVETENNLSIDVESENNFRSKLKSKVKNKFKTFQLIHYNAWDLELLI